MRSEPVGKKLDIILTPTRKAISNNNNNNNNQRYSYLR